MRLPRLLLPGCALLALTVLPATAVAAGGSGPTGGAGAGGTGATTTPPTPTPPPATATTGGTGVGAPTTAAHPVVPGVTAEIVDGLALAPADAPAPVQRAIWAGDAIRLRPYVFGGGHASFVSAGYDCSGSVSYVLHAAGLLKTPEDSSQLESWGVAGVGQWITVYSNPGHAFVEIAGIRFDTSAEQDPDPPPGTGPRWRPLMTSTAGFVARHPALY